MLDLKPPYGEIWDLLKRGRVIPFLGAGASLGARTPTWWSDGKASRLPTGAELATLLAQLSSFPQGESTEDLAKVAQYFRLIVGSRRLRERLREIFAGIFPHGPIHDVLAEAPQPLLIVTTNYDNLIERAFEVRGRPYDLVVHMEDNPEWGAAVAHWKAGADQPEFVAPKSLRINMDRTTVIYKMHGGVDRNDARRDSFLIAEDHYADFLVRFATQTAIPAIFSERFSTNHFLFLGYSLRDWNFRVVLSKIGKDWARSSDEETPSWAIQYNPSSLEQALWERRGVRIFDMTINDFVSRLRSETSDSQLAATETTR